MDAFKQLYIHYLSQVSLEQLKEHFLEHENVATGETAGAAVGPVAFPCVACNLSFKFRRELDNHTLTKHGGRSGNMKEKLDLLSDTDSEEDETTTISSVLPKPKPSSLSKRGISSKITLSPSNSRKGSPAPSAPATTLTSKPATPANVSKTVVKCDYCTKTFDTFKGKKVHISKYHSKDLKRTKVKIEARSPRENKKHDCQICTKKFTELSKLRTHYTEHHFWDNLTEDYKDWTNFCKICDKNFPSKDHLVQHMGNFHSQIDKYLMKRGLRIMKVGSIPDRPVKILSGKCGICNKAHSSSTALKSHLSVKHFQKEILAEFPIEDGPTKRCPKCYQEFHNTSVSTVVGHIGSVHDEVLKFACSYSAGAIDLSTADAKTIPIDDFEEVGGKDEKEKDENISSLENKTFDYLSCQICLDELSSDKSLKRHYITHFKDQFGKQYFTSQCIYCNQTFSSIQDTQIHVATDHAMLSLIPLMEERQLWVDKSVYLDEKSVRMKTLCLKIKKVERENYQKQFEDLEQPAPAIADNTTFRCTLPKCTKVYNSRDHLLSHFVINHFYNDMREEYRAPFKEDPKKCPICKELVNPQEEYIRYLKHLGVTHETVVKYLPAGSRSTVSSVASTSRTIPATRVSNEPGVEVSNAGNASVAQSSVKAEKQIKTESVEESVKMKRDILKNKVREVFSGESSDTDSD